MRTRAVSSAGLAWFWSEEQDRTVRRLYRSHGALFLAERLGKSVRAIETRALRLGVAKKRPPQMSQSASAIRAREWRKKERCKHAQIQTPERRSDTIRGLWRGMGEKAETASQARQKKAAGAYEVGLHARRKVDRSDAAGTRACAQKQSVVVHSHEQNAHGASR